MNTLLQWLRLPEASELDLDTPEATVRHGQILRSKPFLANLYRDWYSEIAGLAPGRPLLEIGSGAGFITSVVPEARTSDVQAIPGLDHVFPAEAIPFADESLGSIVMLNVLHHIPQPVEFLHQAARTLRPGGRIVCLEPANTLWSRWVYRRFHHEPFEPGAGLTIAPGRPLSHSNQALPWILFVRERPWLEQTFPNLRILSCRCHTPLRYLLSGGFSLRSLVPASAYPIVRACERLLAPLDPWLGMFMTCVVEKVSESGSRSRPS